MVVAVVALVVGRGRTECAALHGGTMGTGEQWAHGNENIIILVLPLYADLYL